MATGDFSNLAIESSGEYFTIDVENLSAAIPAGFEVGKSAWITIASDGYTGTTFTAGNGFTVDIPVYFVSASFAPSTVYNLDTFTEAGSTALASHTPDTGGAWVALVNGGTVAVAAGGGYVTWSAVTGGGQWDFYAVDSGQSDVRLSSIWTNTGTNQRLGMCFRGSNSSNYWRFETRVGASADGSILTKVVGGVSTAVTVVDADGNSVSAITGNDASGDPNYFVTSATETLQIVCNGSSIKVYFHGKLKMSATDSALATNTKHGIGTRSLGPRCTDFSVGSIAGVLTCRMASEHYVATADTTTFSADAGLLSDGVATSNAAVAVAGTNSSAIPQQPPICRHAFAVDSANELVGLFQATSGSIYVDVLAGHAYGISAVKVDVTDGSTTLSNTQTSLSLSTHVDDIYAAEAEYQGYTYIGSGVYRCGPFNLASLTDAKLTVTATAYPKRGGASVLVTDSFKIINNNGGTYTSSDQYVDSTGTLTLSSGLTADVLDNQLITGNTSGAVAITRGAHVSGSTSVAAHYMSGTFSAAETVTVTNHKQATVATGVFSSSAWNGNDANPGTSGSPVRLILKAVQNILVANHFGNVYIKGRCRTPGSTPEIQNVAAISIRTWPGQTGNVVINNSTAASKIRHLHYYADLNCATQWGTGQDSGTLFSGSGLTTEGHIAIRGLLTHARGRDGSRHIQAKPVNGSAFPNRVCFINATVQDIGTDVIAAQGALPYGRNVMGYKVANNFAFDPAMMFCVAGRDCKVAPNKLYYDTGTLVGTPAIGDIIYQSTTGYWCVITDYYDPGKLFVFDPAAGGANNQATTNRQFSDDFDASFYDPANFNQATGLPTGSADGTFGVGIVHPDGLQYAGSGNPNHNAVAINFLLSDCDGQMYYTNDVINALAVNFLAVRTQANQQLSQFGASSATDYVNSRNCLIWNFTLPNQELTCRPDSLTTRVGFQVRSTVAAKFTGGYQRHGIYDSKNVARLTGSVAGMDLTQIADVFENGVAADADYNAATNDYRPNANMPTTDDVPWAFDLLGNALVGDGSDYAGALQEVAGGSGPGDSDGDDWLVRFLVMDI
jgi:hypothetical protein